MRTQVLDANQPEAIALASRLFSQGELVGFPTETVYGLGGDAFNPASSRKIYAAKGRPSDNPLIVHICRTEDLACIADPITEDEYLTKNSEQFHQHLGFVKVGEFHRCACKFGRWYNMIWMEKFIGKHI